MLYYSTQHRSDPVNFKEATLKGQPDDGGLYFPEKIPLVSEELIENIHQFSEEEIAYEVIAPYTKGAIPAPVLAGILVDVVNFKIPIAKVSKTISALELHHGTTLSFKDIGAKFMSLCLEYFLQQEDKRTIVLTATTGDAGGALAKAFYDVDGVEMVVLYPAGQLNMVQEKQLTSLGNNIHAIEVAGTFDQCKEMVKQSFADQELLKKFNLSPAGSSNIARWLPQQFYYYFAYKQWVDKQDLPVLSVPCGNLSNLSAGLLAYKAGLPVKHFIAACNANNAFCDFLETGKYEPRKTVSTISNSMDAGEPLNFARVLEIFGNDIDEIKKIVSAYTISDKETRSVIRSTYEKNGYLLDPHGAVAYVAAQKYLQQYPDQKALALKTAHAVKFYEVVEPIIDEPATMPASIELELAKKKIYKKMNADANMLNEFLLSL